jgi:hypothetical protein
MKIDVTPSQITVTLSVFETPFAMKHRLEIPTENIALATAVDRSEVHRPLVRAPGTYLPGLLSYGSFGVGEGREFWAVPGRPRLLVIDIQNWTYSRAVLAVPDPDQVAGTINAAKHTP